MSEIEIAKAWDAWWVMEGRYLCPFDSTWHGEINPREIWIGAAKIAFAAALRARA